MGKWIGTFLGSFILVWGTGCSGPSVTSSDTSGSNGQVSRRGMPDPAATRSEETLAAGTVIRAVLQRALSTESNTAGDQFTLKVVDDVRVSDRVTVPIGSTIKGVVADSVRSGRVKGRAHMSLRFTHLVLPNGQSYSIDASPASRTAVGTKKRDAMIIGGGAGLGTAIGALAGGGRGAAIGAASGAGAGTGVVLATRGKETGFASGSTLDVKFVQPLKIKVL